MDGTGVWMGLGYCLLSRQCKYIQCWGAFEMEAPTLVARNRKTLKNQREGVRGTLGNVERK